MRETNTQQKKNNNTRSILVIALLLLLVAVIGFGGYTMSKYISSADGSGTARVAKWGFTVTADADNLFGQHYQYNGTVFASTKVAETETKLTVSANDAVVAPGTTGSMNFTIAGTAEVAAKLTIKFENVHDVHYGTDYYPVVWTLTKKGADESVATGKLSAIEAAFSKTEKIAIGATSAYAGEYTLSWAWAFESVDDVKDTALGQIANGTLVKGENDNTTISFELTVTVEQVKEVA